MDLQTYDGSTALLLACINLNASKATVRLLLMRKANPCLRNDKGYAPLHAAVCSDAPDLKVTKWLVRRGATVNDLSCGDRTPLHYVFAPESVRAHMALGAEAASGLPLQNHDSEKRQAVTSFLLKHGANMHVFDDNGCRPFDCAVIAKCYKSAKSMLLSIEPDKRKGFLAYGPGGESCLHYAVTANAAISSGFVDLLLENGADPDRFGGDNDDMLPINSLLADNSEETEESLKVLKRLLKETTVYGPRHVPQESYVPPKNVIELCIQKGFFNSLMVILKAPRPCLYNRAELRTATEIPNEYLALTPWQMTEVSQLLSVVRCGPPALEMLTDQHFEALKLMVDLGWSVNAINERYISPLAVILREGGASSPELLNDIVDFLLEKGAVIRPDARMRRYITVHSLVSLPPRLLARKLVIYLEDIANDVKAFRKAITQTKYFDDIDLEILVSSFLYLFLLSSRLSGGAKLSKVQELHDVLLHVLGERLPPDFAALDKAYEMAREVPKLQKITRLVVRRKLNECGRLSEANVNRLALPDQLKKFVQFGELTCNQRDDPELQQVINRSSDQLHEEI